MTEDALGRAVRKYDSTRQRYGGDAGGISKLDKGNAEGSSESWTLLAAKFWLNLFGTNACRIKPLRNSSLGEEAGGDLETEEVKGEDEDWLERDVSSWPLSGTGRGPLGNALLHYFTWWRSKRRKAFATSGKSGGLQVGSHLQQVQKEIVAQLRGINSMQFMVCHPPSLNDVCV